jgi:hypothetical protein
MDGKTVTSSNRFTYLSMFILWVEPEGIKKKGFIKNKLSENLKLSIYRH